MIDMIRPHVDYDLYDGVVRELRAAERVREEQRAEIERLRTERKELLAALNHIDIGFCMACGEKLDRTERFYSSHGEGDGYG